MHTNGKRRFRLCFREDEAPSAKRHSENGEFGRGDVKDGAMEYSVFEGKKAFVGLRDLHREDRGA